MATRILDLEWISCLSRQKREFILGVISVYNESDIIEETILHMRDQDVPLVAVDNGSTDGSYEILKSYFGGGIVALARIETRWWELENLLGTLHRMATRYSPEWILMVDADEMPESSNHSINLRQAVKLEDSKGYNLLQFDLFEFWLTKNDVGSSVTDVRKRMKYYSWICNWEFRCFKNYPNTTIGAMATHLPIFPESADVKLSTNKFILRHYPFRSLDQMARKVSERMSRYSEADKKRWNVDRKYARMVGNEEQYLIVDSERLTAYCEDGHWVREPRFDGYRGYTLPNLNSSEEVRAMMESVRGSLGVTAGRPDGT